MSVLQSDSADARIMITYQSCAPAQIQRAYTRAFWRSSSKCFRCSWRFRSLSCALSKLEHMQGRGQRDRREWERKVREMKARREKNVNTVGRRGGSKEDKITSWDSSGISFDSFMHKPDWSARYRAICLSPQHPCCPVYICWRVRALAHNLRLSHPTPYPFILYFVQCTTHRLACIISLLPSELTWIDVSLHKCLSSSCCSGPWEAHHSAMSAGISTSTLTNSTGLTRGLDEQK